MDNIQGTTGNDTIIGSVDSASGGNAELNTMSSIDIINGGAGTDTLKIAHASSTSGTITMANVSNVEVITIESADASGATVNTSSIAGVTNLNVTKAAGAVSATAASTTDVNLTLKDIAGSKAANAVKGANNVTITATDLGKETAASGDTFTIGSGNAPKGDVVVNLTGAKYTGAAMAFGSGDTVDITGGKTITVTQVASSDASFAASSNANTSSVVTQADVKVTANTDTTTISIKQDVATAKNASATTGGVTETASVKFGALKSGNTLNLDLDGSGADSGITLTAKADMTAAEVAQAFANLLTSSPRLDASGNVDTAGDTQGSIAYTKATYTVDTSVSGSGASLWSSAAAAGDTVVFTAATANTNVTDLTFTESGSGATAPVQTNTQGKANDATYTGGVMGAAAGKVTVVGSSALKTVTVDGYGSGSEASGTTAMETLTLSNSAANIFTVNDSAATLALNLNNVEGSGAVTFASGAGTVTLNVKSEGDNNLTTVAEATTALNVTGNGTLTVSSGSGSDNIKTITVGETAGLNFSAAGSGLTALESVNTTATTGKVTINIGATATYTGGAGVDMVTVTNASGTGISKAIDLGAGDDTLTLNGTGTTTPTANIKGGDGAADTLSMKAATAATIGTGFMAKVTGFERLTLNDQANTSSANVTVQLKDLGFTSYVTTNGYSGASGLILNNLADNGTVVLAGVGTGSGGAVEVVIEGAADSTTNVLNAIASNSTTGDLGVGTLLAANIETINLTATDNTIDEDGDNTQYEAGDRDTITIALSADKATAVNLGSSNSNLALDVAAATKVATIDGSAMTGALTVNLTAHNGVAMTVKGGTGNDKLTASFGTNAKADVLQGGSGSDVLVAGTNGAKLNGGAGNDLFVLMDSTTSGSASAVGNKEANTYSTIEDFQAGDVLQLLWNTDGSSGNDVGADAVVNSFAKLSATLDAGTAQFSNYVTAAMEQMDATTSGTGGDAVWFKFGSDSYVVVDNGIETTGSFTNGEDLVIKLTGVDLTSASYNATYGTIGL